MLLNIMPTFLELFWNTFIENLNFSTLTNYIPVEVVSFINSHSSNDRHY